jgi:hypothetical protein
VAVRVTIVVPMLACTADVVMVVLVALMVYSVRAEFKK